MISHKKCQVQALVLGMMVFLTLNFFVSGQGPPPDPPVTSSNQPPQILSVRVNSEANTYIITIEITDEDPPESLKVEVRHEDGTTKEAEFIERRSQEGSSAPILVFEVSFVLDPGSHGFAITAEDSQKGKIEKEILIIVPEISAPPRTNQPPQILSVLISNVQNEYTITMKIQDEASPQSLNVYVQSGIELPKKAEFIESISAFEVSFILAERSHTLTITVIDPQGNETALQFPLFVPEMNEAPEIISIKSDSTRDGYVIIVEVEDEDPDTIDVLVEGIPDITFKKGVNKPVSETIKKSTFTSESVHLDPGHSFAIVAKDSEGGVAKMQTAITVPKNGARFLIMLLLMLIPVVAFITFLYARKTPAHRYPDETSRYKEIEFLKDETAHLKRQLADEELHLRETQNNLTRFQENVQNVISEEQITDLARIAGENSQIRKDLSELLRWISQSLQNFSGLNLSSVKQDLKMGIRAYEASKATTSPQEEEAHLRAQNAYQATMAELRRAHGALDVKILELFMKQAHKLLEEPAPHGQKLLNYEASRKLSDLVRTLLKDPELRARLTKLRKVGYIDPFGMS